MLLFKISQKTIQVGYESLFLLCAASKKLLKRCFYVRDREKVISVPKHQNPVLLIFGKNELEAFLESLRPPCGKQKAASHCLYKKPFLDLTLFFLLWPVT